MGVGVFLGATIHALAQRFTLIHALHFSSSLHRRQAQPVGAWARRNVRDLAIQAGRTFLSPAITFLPFLRKPFIVGLLPGAIATV